MKLKKITIMVAAIACCGLMINTVWSFDTIEFDFADPSDYNDNFFETGYFAHSGGTGSGGDAGRVSITSNKTSKTSAIYDTTPDSTWGPDNMFSNIRISVDFEFLENSNKQFCGILFNIDSNRENTSERDCLLFQIRNVAHAGDPYDTWELRRGRAVNPDYGATLYNGNLANLVPEATVEDGNQWIRVVLELTNSPDDSMLDFKATIYDLNPETTTPIIDTITLNDLSYETMDALAYGEVGVIANAYSNSIKWDNFKIEDMNPVPEPSTWVLLGLLAMCGGLLKVWRRQ